MCLFRLATTEYSDKLCQTSKPCYKKVLWIITLLLYPVLWQYETWCLTFPNLRCLRGYFIHTDNVCTEIMSRNAYRFLLSEAFSFSWSWLCSSSAHAFHWFLCDFPTVPVKADLLPCSVLWLVLHDSHFTPASHFHFPYISPPSVSCDFDSHNFLAATHFQC